MGRCKEDSENENFFNEILGDNKFTYFSRENYRTCYEKSDSAKVSINIYSAFGLETLARGNRCCFINTRGKFKTRLYIMLLAW